MRSPPISDVPLSVTGARIVIALSELGCRLDSVDWSVSSPMPSTWYRTHKNNHASEMKNADRETRSAPLRRNCGYRSLPCATCALCPWHLEPYDRPIQKRKRQGCEICGHAPRGRRQRNQRKAPVLLEINTHSLSFIQSSTGQEEVCGKKQRGSSEPRR